MILTFFDTVVLIVVSAKHIIQAACVFQRTIIPKSYLYNIFLLFIIRKKQRAWSKTTLLMCYNAEKMFIICLLFQNLSAVC